MNLVTGSSRGVTVPIVFLESCLGASPYPCLAHYRLCRGAHFIACIRVSKVARLVLMDADLDFYAVSDTFTEFVIVAIR